MNELVPPKQDTEIPQRKKILAPQKNFDPKKTIKVPSIPMGSFLSFYCRFFTTNIIDGAKELVVLL